jgi:hypothetical protein
MSPSRLKLNKALYNLHTLTPMSLSQLSWLQTCESVELDHHERREKEMTQRRARKELRERLRVGLRPWRK